MRGGHRATGCAFLDREPGRRRASERLWQPGHSLGGETGSAPGLALQLPPPGAKATDLAPGARQCGKKAFSSELLCYFWLLHHF